MRRSYFAAVIFFSLALSVVPASAGELSLTLNPEAIEIGTLFNGMILNVSGTAPAGCDLVVRIMGAPGEIHMKHKGRALGLLWMNLGSLSFEEVPSLYLVTATKPLDQLGPGAQPFTLEGIQKQIQVEPAAADTEENRAEFVKLKNSEGSYREDPPAVVLGPENADSRTFHAQIRMPSRLVPGTYSVEAVALRDGHAVSREQKKVPAKLIGVPALLSKMAFGNAALYGVMATVIALLAGFGIGLVFQSKGAH